MKLETREQLEQYLHGDFKTRFESYLNKKLEYQVNIIDLKGRDYMHHVSIDVLSDTLNVRAKLTIYFEFDDTEWKLLERAYFETKGTFGAVGQIAKIYRMTPDYAYSVYDEFRIQCIAAADSGIELLKFKDKRLAQNYPERDKQTVLDYQNEEINRLRWFKRLVAERPASPSLKESVNRILRETGDE